jgi:hypothetical protein
MRERALNLSWEDFDQLSANPVSFRALANHGCKREAAELVLYYLAHAEGLNESQRRLSRFHAGQLLAEVGDNARARALIRSAHWPEQPSDASLDWNSYVAGVVAFLEGDRAALAAARERLEIAGPSNAVDAGILMRMESCFEKGYADIWTHECASPATP